VAKKIELALWKKKPVEKPAVLKLVQTWTEKKKINPLNNTFRRTMSSITTLIIYIPNKIFIYKQDKNWLQSNSTCRSSNVNVPNT